MTLKSRPDLTINNHMNFKDTLLERKYEVTLLICITVYTMLFSYFTYMKYYSFSSFAWDLGVFNQVFYSSILGGGPSTIRRNST
jgi:hypothetical protein